VLDAGQRGDYVGDVLLDPLPVDAGGVRQHDLDADARALDVHFVDQTEANDVAVPTHREAAGVDYLLERFPDLIRGHVPSSIASMAELPPTLLAAGSPQPDELTRLAEIYEDLRRRAEALYAVPEALDLAPAWRFTADPSA